MLVVPCSRLISRSRFITSTVEATSRSPVGSSSRRTLGSLATARAIATRCCSPPDSSLGRCSSLSPSPTLSSKRMARLRLSLRPSWFSIIMGSSTFSTADMADIRLKVWKT
mmetsp:Transcript_3015/g.9240  ORF Transcript_3015/g.9240 Transcript_3015/m.9240 type:complete len:111 (-) Transcript_3015:602-934(-)